VEGGGGRGGRGWAFDRDGRFHLEVLKLEEEGGGGGGGGSICPGLDTLPSVLIITITTPTLSRYPLQFGFPQKTGNEHNGTSWAQIFKGLKSDEKLTKA